MELPYKPMVKEKRNVNRQKALGTGPLRNVSRLMSETGQQGHCQGMAGAAGRNLRERGVLKGMGQEREVVIVTKF